MKMTSALLARREKIKALISQGKSNGEIARETGCAKTVVHYWRNKLAKNGRKVTVNPSKRKYAYERIETPPVLIDTRNTRIAKELLHLASELLHGQ